MSEKPEVEAQTEQCTEQPLKLAADNGNAPDEKKENGTQQTGADTSTEPSELEAKIIKQIEVDPAKMSENPEVEAQTEQCTEQPLKLAADNGSEPDEKKENGTQQTGADTSTEASELEAKIIKQIEVDPAKMSEKPEVEAQTEQCTEQPLKLAADNGNAPDEKKENGTQQTGADTSTEPSELEAKIIKQIEVDPAKLSENPEVEAQTEQCTEQPLKLAADNGSAPDEKKENGTQPTGADTSTEPSELEAKIIMQMEVDPAKMSENPEVEAQTEQCTEQPLKYAADNGSAPDEKKENDTQQTGADTSTEPSELEAKIIMQMEVDPAKMSENPEVEAQTEQCTEQPLKLAADNGSAPDEKKENGTEQTGADTSTEPLELEAKIIMQMEVDPAKVDPAKMSENPEVEAQTEQCTDQPPKPAADNGSAPDETKENGTQQTGADTSTEPSELEAKIIMQMEVDPAKMSVNPEVEAQTEQCTDQPPKPAADSGSAPDETKENGTQQTWADISTEPSELEAKIIKQIEFYFGDYNLCKDKFLQTEIKADDGWVPLDTMLKFNRLANLSTDCDVIVAAIAKSSSGLMEVSEDKSKIRRCPDKPLPELTKDIVVESRKRTVYAKNFPVEATLDQLMAHFEEFGAVEWVKMRRDGEKKFKGSVFTTYRSKESADKYLSEKREYKIDEQNTVELITKHQEEYFKIKNEEKKELRQQGKHDKGQENEDKEQRYQEQKEKSFLEGITKGAILELTGLHEETKREDIASLFNLYGVVAWQDFNKGDPKARVRFEDEGGARTAWDAAVAAAEEGKVTILDKQVEGRVLEGDEETEHWRKMRASQNEIRRRAGDKRKRGGRGGGGPRHKQRKTGGD